MHVHKNRTALMHANAFIAFMSSNKKSQTPANQLTSDLFQGMVVDTCHSLSQNQKYLFGHISDPGHLCEDHIWSLSQRPPGCHRGHLVSFLGYRHLQLFLSRGIVIASVELMLACLLIFVPSLKRPCIEFGVARIDSAMAVCIHSAIIQLLLTRRVSYCFPAG